MNVFFDTSAVVLTFDAEMAAAARRLGLALHAGSLSP